MTIAAGTRLGPYEVTASIGAGGMGEVYRATDTRLDRQVAIKVLPPELAQDTERLARFGREAKLLASLNHPNIAHVYGFEAATLSDGSTTHFLAMELVEGEDLAGRLTRGAVPVDESIAIAKQIAEGLEEAHEHGIIHRDLKPANIKVTPDGKVKILDFGLAKALEGDGGANSATSQLSQSPTLSRRMTEAGMIMGTAAYMSPEQAKGKPLDQRTDVWAFGVVLYEMLTGRRAFTGDDVTEVLAAVIRDTPDANALPAETPAPIRRLLRRCLEKDRHERLASMGVARLEIKDALSGASEAVTREPQVARPTRGFLGGSRAILAPGLLSGLLAIALGVTLVSRKAPGGRQEGVLRFALADNPRLQVQTETTQPFAISPDGSTIVFNASTAEGSHLFARTLDDPEPRLIEDTRNGVQPAISPDGEWVAFVVGQLIRKARIRGGGATLVGSMGVTSAAITWGAHQDILFEVLGIPRGISHVSANGGEPGVLIPIDTEAGEVRQRRPFVLRNPYRVLYASTGKDGRTTLGSFSPDDGRRAHLPLQGVQALGMVEGHLIYARGDGALMAVLFDPQTMESRGTAVQLKERVSASIVGTAVMLSGAGTLVYVPFGSGLSQLMLVEENGASRPLGNWTRAFGTARFSPDGKRVAVGIATGGEGEGLWVVEPTTGEPTRVGGGDLSGLVDWTPDGRTLISLRDGELWATPVDGGRASTRLFELHEKVRHAALVPDGRSLVVGTSESGLVRAYLEPGKASEPLVAASQHPYDPRISPDGKWLAFADGIRDEVHVRALEGGAGVQVSTEQGESPVWGAHEGQLFFTNWVTGHWWSEVELQTAPTLEVRRRRDVETLPSRSMLHDVSPDGRTFLVTRPTEDTSPPLVALNWAASLKQQLK